MLTAVFPFAAMIIGLGLFASVAAPIAGANPVITAEPITWPTVGLRSNVNPGKPGPDRFPVGTRFCNAPGATTAPDVRTRFVLEGNGTGSATGFSVDSRATETLGEIPPGECRDSYLNVVLAQSKPNIGNAREYFVEACAGACSGSGTSPSANKYSQYPAATSTRKLLIESLVSQNRNVTRKISGPGGCNFDFTQCDPPPTNLTVGKTYTYKLYAQTSTAYEQVESFITFPAEIFQILGAESTYSTPAGLTIDQPWANACGWNFDYNRTNTKCIGPIPQDFQPGGKAGRQIVTTYTVKVLNPVSSASSTNLTSLIYDLSGSSFHYNADYGAADNSIDYTSNYPLTTSVTGSGNLTSTSSPTQSSQVNCGFLGSNCRVDYPSSASVTLTPAAAPGWVFTGWGGACTGTASSSNCTVTMSQARDVTATFTGLSYFPLNVTVAGKGSVSSSPSGISCSPSGGTGCGKTWADGTSVTLTAQPDEGNQFTGWSGACTGSSTTCTVSMTQARETQALFEPAPVVTRSLTVTDLPVDADGETLPPIGGRITSAATDGSGGISLDCSFQCIGEYLNNSAVTVTATPASGYKLASWGGACASVAVSGDGTGAQTCNLTMSQNRLVSASFVLTSSTTSYNLTTSTRLNGNAPGLNVGTVTGNVGGLVCSFSDSTNCVKSYLSGTLVTLTAAPASGYLFAGWQNGNTPGETFTGCGGEVDPTTSTTCAVSMTAAQTVRANFVAIPSGYLEVNIAGGGDGSVKSPSSGDDIFCATGNAGTCDKTYPINTEVTLTATPNSNSTFGG